MPYLFCLAANEQAQFEAALQSKTALEADAAATQQRMDSANTLLSALAGEERRWTEQSQAFDATIQRLTGSGNAKFIFVALACKRLPEQSCTTSAFPGETDKACAAALTENLCLSSATFYRSCLQAIAQQPVALCRILGRSIRSSGRCCWLHSFRQQSASTASLPPLL